MKKLLFVLCCMFCTLAFASCSKENSITSVPDTPNVDKGNNNGGGNGNTGSDNGNGDDNNGGEKPQNGKILIVYFSRAGENWQVGYVDRGNTAVMADYIKEFTGADMFEIEPSVPYPTDYQEMLQVSNHEAETNARPAIKNKLENLDQYDVVFIGSPIWRGNPPMIMRTFYESYPGLATKTIVPFGTHGGSGIGSCSSLIRTYFPDAKLLESLGISGTDIRGEQAKERVENWIERIGYKK